MNTIEKVTIGIVLSTALGLFILSHMMTAFFLAVCATLYLGARMSTLKSSRRDSFTLPGKGWSIMCQARNIPVLYSTCATDHVMRFMAGQALEVELKQEEATQAEQDVSVYGRWTDGSGCQQHRKLGCIPAQEITGLYSETQRRPECLVSARVSEVFVPTRQNPFPGLSLDIAVLEPVHDRKKARRRTG